MAKKVKKQKSVEKIVVQEENSSRVMVKLPKKIFQYVLALLIVAGLIYFGGKVLFVASVNGQLVNRLSVIKELEKQGGKKTLDTIVLKTLINQEAKKRKLTIPQSEIDAEMKKIEVNVSSQGSTLDALLAQQGMTKDDLVGEIKLQLLVTKMVDNNVSVTDKEADDYIASQKGQSSLDSTQPAPELTRDQAKVAIKQQKLQTKIQSFVADLKAKAKINYFVKY
ncbi:MAG: SurA N-terminal domain-containing protein [Patescibacteria group bacterium]